MSTKLRHKYSGNTLTLSCTETYFQAGLGRMRQGIPYKECFKALRIAERDRLFEFLMEPLKGKV